ncbi:methylglyoxal synthase [Sphingosinicella terrae]|uniref:methylglyoxal synthase n=1 Tax=Sphingosinicella terrae TaxID=2172047 RepID=UPI000E0DB80F|nr:methylglyoxal synthase [Sphingosinicella terrae]
MYGTIGLVAHDDRKDDLVEWVSYWAEALGATRIYATGTTGGRIAAALPALDVTLLKSGPLGGDQQLGALIAEERIEALVFFVDALSPHPHDVDVKALIRMATLADIPFACNRATADAIMKTAAAG